MVRRETRTRSGRVNDYGDLRFEDVDFGAFGATVDGVIASPDGKNKSAWFKDSEGEHHFPLDLGLTHRQHEWAVATTWPKLATITTIPT